MSELSDTQEMTLEALAARLDAYESESKRRDDQLGLQMNWLCEKLQSLFLFVDKVGQSGGGLRGMMQVIKHPPPELMSQPMEGQNE